MQRFFNDMGPCQAERHYMLPPLERLPELAAHIEAGRSFILRAPHQTGKTTAMQALAYQLCGQGYVAIRTSLATSCTASTPKEAEPLWLSSIATEASFDLDPEVQPPPIQAFLGRAVNTRLRDYLGAWSRVVPKPIVLLLDGATGVHGEAMVSLLAQLRGGIQHGGPGRFPISVGLIRLRSPFADPFDGDGMPSSSTSPFNVVITLRDFNRDEVAALFQQHTDDTGQQFLPEAVDNVMYWTEGQPCLVNALARHAVTVLVTDRAQPIRPEHIEQAKDALIRARVVHLDYLAERLRERRVARIFKPILLGEGKVDSGHDDFQYCVDLGLVRSTRPITVKNAMYREMLALRLTQSHEAGLPDIAFRWHTSDRRLDFPALIASFRQFWQENADQYQDDDSLYREATPQLVFMAFLQRVVNGGGRITREYAAGRGRIDLLIELAGGRHVVELKRALNPAAMAIARRDGLVQLAEYLDTTGVREGWLLIFDLRAAPSWEEKLWSEDIEIGGRVMHLRGC